MSSSVLPRLVLRQSRLLAQRRAASTTSGAAEAASKGASAAKETAQNSVSKAQQGLSRVTSSAGPALSKVAASAQNAVAGVGGRTGAVIGWVQSRKQLQWAIGVIHTDQCLKVSRHTLYTTARSRESLER